MTAASARFPLWLAACLAAGCATVATQAPRPETSPELPAEIHWVRNSAEYRALLVQSYRLAEEALERRVADRDPGTWALAIDADETLISNSQQSKEQALAGHDSYIESWDEWVERRAAPALPGAKRFLERVHELGGRIAVVTNREERHCPQTADNLRAEGLPFDVVLCKGETGDKAPRWRRVEEGTADPELPPLEIVMWVGDNIHDFPGFDQESRFASPESLAEFGNRFFLLPNPLYGSWEDNPKQ